MKMTASVLQSYDWYKAHPNVYALENLKGMLSGEFTGNEATRRGEAYEDYVNKHLLENTPFDLEIENHMFEGLKGMDQQRWIKPLDVTTDLGVFTFKGRLDYASPTKIVDLKTTKRFREEDFLKKWQHTIYCHAEGIMSFEYIVAEFPDATGVIPTALYKVVPTIQSLETLAKAVEVCAHFLDDRFPNEFRKWSGYEPKETVETE